MKINFIDLQGQYRKYKNEIDEQIAQTLDSSAYIGGQKVALLEENLARFSGAKHAIACSNGSSAIFVSLLALGIGRGDEVITSPFTFFATAEMIALTGAKPVFVDIDEKTYNIDPSLIQAAITPKTKAIMPVSLFGQIADMKRINQIAEKQDGARSCSLSKLATTSFFPAKPLGCYGDGGAIFTSDDELAQKIKILLNHGSKERYFHSAIGINGRLDAIQAGVLNVKLKYFEDEIARRQEVAARYDQNLKNVVTPFVESGNTSVWAQYCIRVKDRAKMLEICAQKGVPTGVYYPLPLHLQEVFRDLGYKKGDFAVSERVSEDIMALPMSAFLSEQEQDYVIEVINNA